ncbi:MAG: PKD domain-containing protein [Chthoniobacterales bacterium]
MNFTFGISRALWMAGICFFCVTAGFAQTPDSGQLPAKGPNWLAGFQIRYLVRVTGNPTDFANAQSILVSLPTGTWLRADGSDVVAQSASGKVLPTAVLSHAPGGRTVVQFQREGDERFYWVYAMAPNGAAASNKPIAQEGIVAEYRQWNGDVLDSWDAVVKGLKQSNTVIGNSFVSNIHQRYNPVRPDNPRNFAASYRGFLNITKPGTYKFFLNTDDAGFLFIDGFKVYEALGSRIHINGVVKESDFKPIELAVGIHPFEVHHVMGNSAQSAGKAVLVWKMPDKPPYYIPLTAFNMGMYAEVARVENFAQVSIPIFAFGIDDTLSSDGVNLYLARFEAQGDTKDPQQLVWDFGDGTTGTGKTVEHIYFTPGDYKVSLKSPAFGFPFTQMVHVFAAPVATSPFSLAIATKLLAGVLASPTWTTTDPQKLNMIFDFLLISEQKDRWPLLEKIARHLLTLPGNDPQRRVIFYTTLMKALAEQGNGTESIKLMDTALNEFQKLPSMEVEIMLAAADIYRVNLKDYENASRLYEKLIEGHRGVGTPGIRQAAIHWGDLFTESDDIAQAEARYRMAKDLGGQKFQSTGTMDAIKQGALLRVAEQKLNTGEVRQSRQLLERIEIDFPEQKLQGLYRFLRAEADRYAGRYEEAIRNYEVLIKLSQWSSYRDRAFYGIADCYYRMGEFDKTLKWLDTLKASFPDFYTKKKLDKYRKVVESHKERVEVARTKTAANPQAEGADMEFKGFETGFEPDEHQNLGHPENFKFTPLLGMMGPTVGLMQAYNGPQQFEYFKHVSNMTVNGTYWVEFWYRDMLGGPPSVTISLVGSRGESNEDGGSVTVGLDSTYGEWRKVGAILKAPVTQDGILNITFPTTVGTVIMDAVKIFPVTDREFDSLHSFVQGTATQ